MAKLKLSELERVASANPNDLIYLVQSSTSKGITVHDLLGTANDISLQGNVTFGGEPQIISASGSFVDLTTPITYLRVPSGSQDINIPNGANGQIKVFITQSSSGGTFSLRGNILGSGLNFSATGDDAIVVYSGNAWFVVGQTAFRSANSYVSTVNGVGPGEITLTSDDIGEGSTNLYFTEDRISSKLTTANVAELDNLYFTEQRVIDVLENNADATGFVQSTLTDLGTAGVPETTDEFGNLIRYFNEDRVSGAIRNEIILATVPFKLPIMDTANADGYVNDPAAHDFTYPGVSKNGYMFYNSDIDKVQVYTNNTWANLTLS